MGDDELNFTEEESRQWARDPRNQEGPAAGFGTVVVCLLIVTALLMIWVGLTPPVDPQMAN